MKHISDEEKYAPATCRQCLMRKIAILIVSGKVKATEITKRPPLKSFWKIKNKTNRKKIGQKYSMAKLGIAKQWNRSRISFFAKVTR